MLIEQVQSTDRNPQGRAMRFLTLIGKSVLCLLLSFTCLGVAHAQVKIENPSQLEIPQSRVQLLHQTVCRVVASEFHLKAGELDGPLTLIMGGNKGAVGKILPGGADPLALYLDHWDEAAFVVTDMQLTLHRLLSRGREKKMMRDVFRRLNQTVPVDVRALRNAGVQLNSPSTAGDCISAIGDASRAGCTAAQFPIAGRP